MKTIKHFITILLLCIIGSIPAHAQQSMLGNTIAKQIAQKAGQASLDNYSEIQFTFQVVRDNKVLNSREWTWNLKTQDVKLVSGTNTVTYNRAKPMDSLQIQADKSFVNDSYWLLPEFKFYTDSGTTIVSKPPKLAPIANKSLNLFTITYGGDGGYTPGDAYDVYYNDDFIIQEWAYRAGNGEKINLQNGFSNHQTFNGLTVATEHLFADGKTMIKFINIAVTQ